MPRRALANWCGASAVKGPQHVTVRGRMKLSSWRRKSFAVSKAAAPGGAHRRDASVTLPRDRYRTQARADARSRRDTVTGWLLDTNVLSELRRPNRTQSRRLRCRQAARAALRQHRHLRRNPLRHRARRRCRIAPSSTTGSRTRCGRCSRNGSAGHRGSHVQVAALGRRGRKAGHTYSQPDLIIAATALHHGLTLVSRDTAHFNKARVSVLNPWRETSGA